MENPKPIFEQGEEHPDYGEYQVTKGEDTEHERRSDPAIELPAFGAEIDGELNAREEAPRADVEERKAEFKDRLFGLIDEAMDMEINEVLEGSAPSGEQMVSNVLDRAIHLGGLAILKEPQQVEAIKKNPPLRDGIKKYLVRRLQDRLEKSGNDQARISKIMKALDVLEA